MKNYILEIRHFNDFYARIINEVQTPYEMLYSARETKLLVRIHETGITCAKDLSEQTGIDKGSLSRLLVKMQYRDLIDIQPMQEDKRFLAVCLTIKGKKEVPRIAEQMEKKITKLLNPLKEEAKSKLVQHMNAITELLAQK